MKGFIAAVAVLIISFVFGQVLDEVIDGTIETSTGLMLIPLYTLKILLGLPTDVIGWFLKIVLLIGIVAGGEAV